MDEIKSAYEKGEKIGFKKGVEQAVKIIKDCERDPQDITRLSLLVERQLDALMACD